MCNLRERSFVLKEPCAQSAFSLLENCQKSSGLQVSRTNISAIPERHSTQLALLQEDNYSSLNYTTPPKPWAALEPPEAKGLDQTTLVPCDSDRNIPGLPVISIHLYAVTLPQRTLCTAETSPNTYYLHLSRSHVSYGAFIQFWSFHFG